MTATLLISSISSISSAKEALRTTVVRVRALRLPSAQDACEDDDG